MLPSRCWDCGRVSSRHCPIHCGHWLAGHLLDASNPWGEAEWTAYDLCSRRPVAGVLSNTQRLLTSLPAVQQFVSVGTPAARALARSIVEDFTDDLRALA